jgi:GNAT superfamily N-acetyltransferase
MIRSNLAAALLYFASLPSSLASFARGAFLYWSGVESASENWVIADEGSPAVLKAVRRFFARRGGSMRDTLFVWPVLDPRSGSEKLSRALTRAGLPYRGSLVGMAADLVGNPPQGSDSPLSVHEAETEDAVHQWATVCWRGFGSLGSPEAPPEPYFRFAENLGRRGNGRLSRALGGETTLLTFREGDEPVGTALLIGGPHSMGLYDFAVVPEKRRRGFATRMMDEVARRSRLAGYRFLTLQATPAGVPFYEKWGLASCTPIPIHSASPDVF